MSGPYPHEQHLPSLPSPYARAGSDRSSPLIWTQFFLISSNKSAICRAPRGAMLLSTLPPVWKGHLQGLENPGLLRIGAG
jgi:hypothetical protein